MGRYAVVASALVADRRGINPRATSAIGIIGLYRALPRLLARRRNAVRVSGYLNTGRITGKNRPAHKPVDQTRKYYVISYYGINAARLYNYQ